MKTLIKIPNIIWIILASIFCVTMVFVIYILNYEIENTKSVKLESDASGNSLLVDSETFYKIDIKSNINIKFNDHDYSFVINEWEYDNKIHMFKLKIHNASFTLPSHASVIATLNLEPKTIMSIIFGSV